MEIQQYDKEGKIGSFETGEKAIWIKSSDGTIYNLFDTHDGKVVLKESKFLEGDSE